MSRILKVFSILACLFGQAAAVLDPVIAVAATCIAVYVLLDSGWLCPCNPCDDDSFDKDKYYVYQSDGNIICIERPQKQAGIPEKLLLFSSCFKFQKNEMDTNIDRTF